MVLSGCSLRGTAHVGARGGAVTKKHAGGSSASKLRGPGGLTRADQELIATEQCSSFEPFQALARQSAAGGKGTKPKKSKAKTKSIVLEEQGASSSSASENGGPEFSTPRPHAHTPQEVAGPSSSPTTPPPSEAGGSSMLSPSGSLDALDDIVPAESSVTVAAQPVLAGAAKGPAVQRLASAAAEPPAAADALPHWQFLIFFWGNRLLGALVAFLSILLKFSPKLGGTQPQPARRSGPTLSWPLHSKSHETAVIVHVACGDPFLFC